VIILSGRSNTFDALAPCMPICRECLKSISPGVVIRVTQP
jgi:hypothetical protein